MDEALNVKIKCTAKFVLSCMKKWIEDWMGLKFVEV